MIRLAVRLAALALHATGRLLDPHVCRFANTTAGDDER